MAKLVIANGLRLDFTLAAAGVSDNFLGVDATGSPTYFASIPVARIAPQTANRAATFNGSGILVPSATTATELGFVAGVTSAIQTQLNAKQPLVVLAFNRAVVSDGVGALAASATTATEIGYSSGVTSAIQTQLNAKQATITGGASSIVSANLTVNRALMSDGSGKVAVSTVTATELGYSSGVTSSLQSQINGKLTVTVTTPASGDVITYNGAAWVNSASAAQGVPVGGTAGQYLNKINSTNYNTQWSTLILSKVTDVTSTAAELNLLHGVTTSTVQFNYLNTVTSDVQSQINARLINNLALNAIWIGNASNNAIQLSAGTSGYVLTSVSGVPTWQPSAGGGGGIAGPGTSTLNAAVRWSNTLGTVIKDSVVVISDAGLITGGTWNGNLVTGQYGGTGVANTGKTITLGGNFTTSGAFATTLTVTNTTNVTLPTSGTLSTFSNTAIADELIKSNGTNGVPSGLFSLVLGNLDLGPALAGSIRNVNAGGSASDVNLQFNAKGAGTLILVGNAVLIGATTYGIAVGDITIQGNQSSAASTTGGSVRIYSGQGNNGNASSGNIFVDTLTKSGSGIIGSVSFFKNTADFGSGEKVIYIANATTNPSTNPTGGGIMFVKSSDNKPYWRTPTGVETVMLSAGGTGISNSAANNEIPKSDGTNIGPSGIFSTSSGNITTGAWQATPVGLAFGGTNTNLSASAAIGDLIQASSGTAFQRLAAVAAGSYLRSAGVGTLLVWSTTTIPNTVAVGDLWQGSATNVVSVLASVATGNVLLSGGVTTVSAWGKVGLTTHVSGVLPLANGGTASNLTDPAADKLMAWDDTDNTIGFWTLGSGLTYTHATHTLSAAGGGTPGGSATQFQYNNAGAFGGASGLTYNSGTSVVTFSQIPVFTLGLGSATATTQPAATNNTTLATTAYVDALTLSAFTTTLDGFTLASGGAGRLLLGDNTWLPVSTNGFVLTLVAGVPAWAAAGGGGNPFVDSTAIIKGSADATKLLRFEVDGFTTGTTRVLTPPNFDGTIATLAGTETFTNKTLTTPRIAHAGYIADENGNAQITFNTTGSAVNSLSVNNTATGVAPLLTVTGSDTNIGFTIRTKGTGGLTAYGNLVTIGGANYASGSVGIISILGNNSSGSGQAGSDILIKTGPGVTGNASSGNLFLDTDVKVGSGIVGSISFFKTTADFGGGQKVVYFGNATTNPTTNPTGGGLMFVKSADNKPYWRTPAGVETVMLDVVTPPGGSATQIQFNNSGSFGGFGSWDGSALGIPYLRVNPSAGFTIEKYLAFTLTSVSGTSANINLPTGLANNSMVTVVADVIGIQTSATAGATGFGMRVRARFRKNNAGTWVIVGSSVQESVDNDTGDSFSGTPSLSASGGGGNVNFNLSLTTTKTFSWSCWIEAYVTT